MTRLKMKSLTILAASLGMGLLAVSVPASASEFQSSGTYRIRASVPVACWVRPASTVMAAEGMLGSVVEACNSPGGFTVSATYRPLTETETARMTYGDQLLELSKTGQQMLRRSSMATIRSVNYRFDTVKLEQPLVLALTIQPI